MGPVSMKSDEWVVMTGHEVGPWWSGWWLGDTGERSGAGAVKTFHDLVPVPLSILGLIPSLATSICVDLGKCLPLSGLLCRRL